MTLIFFLTVFPPAFFDVTLKVSLNLPALLALSLALTVLVFFAPILPTGVLKLTPLPLIFSFTPFARAVLPLSHDPMLGLSIVSLRAWGSSACSSSTDSSRRSFSPAAPAELIANAIRAVSSALGSKRERHYHHHLVFESP